MSLTVLHSDQILLLFFLAGDAVAALLTDVSTVVYVLSDRQLLLPALRIANSFASLSDAARAGASRRVRFIGVRLAAGAVERVERGGGVELTVGVGLHGGHLLLHAAHLLLHLHHHLIHAPEHVQTAERRT